MFQRGALTDQIQEKAMKFFGRKMEVKELRLIPYLQYELVNDRRLDHRKLNKEEYDLVQDWQNAGYIDLSPNLTVKKEFWDFMCEVLFLAYAGGYNDALEFSAQDSPSAIMGMINGS